MDASGRRAGRKWRRRVAAVLALLLALANAPSAAQTVADAALPRPPCDGPPLPAFAPVGQTPAAQAWRDVPADWQPDPCTGWAAAPAELVVALAGTFAFAGGADDLLTRIGAISDLRSVMYWSAVRGRWRPLFTDAAAVTGPDGEARRADFAPAELIEHGTVYFMQDEYGMVGPAVIGLTLLAHEPDRLVVALRNHSSVGMGFMRLLDPGESEAVFFLQRAATGSWQLYALSRTRSLPGFLPFNVQQSALNRAAALYRHLAGLPTDAEPPLAP
jgi:hypothetical protein